MLHFVALLVICSGVTLGIETRLDMNVLNLSGAALQLYWIDESNENSLISMLSEPLINGTSVKIFSSDSHKFLLKYADYAPVVGGEIEITKGPRNEKVTASHNVVKGLQIVQEVVYEKLNLVKPVEALYNFKDDSKIIAESMRILEDYPHNTTERMIAAVDVCSKYKGSNNFDSCIMSVARFDLEGLVNRKADAIQSVSAMSSRLRNYTCEDNQLESSPALYSTSLSIREKIYDVDVLFETTHAKIWVINDFISPSECETLKKYSGPKLTKATVAADDGTAILSIHRQAQQARYHMNTTDPTADSLYSTYRNVFDITNRIAGYDLKIEGQEGIMVIQYNKADQYTPHCDGSCDGSTHNKGGRVATSVIYCEVPAIGGGTTFTNADVFVKPKNGMATFFSYKGADGKMEEGFTKHSGCPVVEGEKWIGTVWMREGVSKMEPETLYDPSGHLLNG